MIRLPIAEWRARVGAWASEIYPGLDEALWNRQRDRLERALELPVTAVGPPVPPSGPVRLMVIATGAGPKAPTWRPAAGNHLFEVVQSAIDLLGAEAVSVTRVTDGESPHDWHQRFVEEITSAGATHVLANIETDPNDADDWTWDQFSARLSRSWSGTLIGLMYDSAFEWTTIKAKRLAKRNPHCLLVALDRVLTADIPGPRAHVGPVLLPLSRPTQDILNPVIEATQKEIEVSFIGALYDYRLPIIERMQLNGLEVSVNPQRPDTTSNYAESRTDQPEYVQYIRALARSNVTINLSRAHVEETLQLKTRVLEGSFAGCVVATDDQDKSDHYFSVGTQVLRFASPDQGATAINALLEDPDRLRAMQRAARARGQQIAGSVFWGAVDTGLRKSGFPPLLKEPAARRGT